MEAVELPARKYGWKPDVGDRRDRLYSRQRVDISCIPEEVDSRPFCHQILDQGRLGSCTGHGIGANHFFTQVKQNRSELFLPSRLFIYWNERFLEDTVDSDAGASIRDGFKVITRLGVCEEKYWGYNIEKFKVQPPDYAYAEAYKNRVLEYERLYGLDQVLHCLASGYAITFGFSVYESFESPYTRLTGIMKMPEEGESLLGGHCVLAVGYSLPRRVLICQNSYGKDWGDQGYFYLPFEFVSDPDLSDDYWTIKKVA